MATETFDRVKVVRSDKGTSALADVLHKSDKTLKVAVVNTNISLHLRRSDVNKQYVGQVHGIEFTSDGEIV
jgi:citrate lyase gamma subunit